MERGLNMYLSPLFDGEVFPLLLQFTRCWYCQGIVLSDLDVITQLSVSPYAVQFSKYVHCGRLSKSDPNVYLCATAKHLKQVNELCYVYSSVIF